MEIDAPESDATAPRFDVEITQRRPAAGIELDEPVSGNNMVWMLMGALLTGVATLSVVMWMN